MVSSLIICMLLQAVSAHYAFSRLSINDGEMSDHWVYMRQPRNPIPEVKDDTGDHSYWPMRDTYSTDLRCGRNASTAPFKNGIVKTAKVNAGDKLSIGTGPEGYPLGHPGPALFYLAKAPDGVDLMDWDGDGNWFKIEELGPLKDSKTKWMTDGAWPFPAMNATIPEKTPPGKYLLRTEHLFLRREFKNTNFFVSCAHLEITGPGGGTPGPTARFPGAYDDFDPSIWVPARFLYSDISGYVGPGPKVWDGN